ncbi:GIY-YIG nuclease family protein [Pedobacter sp. WC2501]|uniref:GIY-YIG nuclease family protein n=1 Tax=Pedobacter sp. WC2501 TaxID=3461400 RepID=UPI00404584B8
MGLTLIPRSLRAEESKTKFDNDDEIRLTTWMKTNLIMLCLSVTNCIKIELDLIAKYQPPLNIKSNKSPDNILFRQDLSLLRNLTKLGSKS